MDVNAQVVYSLLLPVDHACLSFMYILMGADLKPREFYQPIQVLLQPLLSVIKNYWKLTWLLAVTLIVWECTEEGDE